MFQSLQPGIGLDIANFWDVPRTERRRLTSAAELRRFTALLGIAVFVALALIFVSSSYLRRATFEMMFTFQGDDAAGPVPDGFVYPNPFGVHYFGDFLYPFAYVQLGFPNGYYGLSLLIFVVVRYLPYWSAFLVIIGSTSFLFILLCWKLLGRFDWPDRMQYMVVAVVGTFPFLLSVDRGQMQILQVGTFLCGIVLLFNKELDIEWLSARRASILGAILFALSISIKLTPIFFVAYLVRQRRFGAATLSVLGATTLVLVPLFFFRGGLAGSLRFMRENIVFLQANLYVENNLATNNSLRGLLQSLVVLNPSLFQDWIEPLLKNYSIIVLALAALIVLVLATRTMSLFDGTLLVAIASSLLIDYAGGYTLLFFQAALLISFIEPIYCDRTTSAKRLLAAFLLLPKGVPVLFLTHAYTRSSPTFLSLANPLASCCILGLVIYSAFSPTRANSQEQQ